MRKFYGAYLVVMTVLCVIALLTLAQMVGKVKSGFANLNSSAAKLEQSVASVESAVANKQAELAAGERARQARESDEQAVRIKAAMDAEAAKINREIANRPIPAQVTGWAPTNTLRGRVYSNANLTTGHTPPKAVTDTQDPRLVVEVDPKYGVDLLQRAASDGRINCAAFSYQPSPGVTRNRLYCSQAGK